jgi:AraC family transcriptional regulator
MGASWRLLASGPGWQAGDVLCDAGPHDRPFEERHADFCIALVTEGSFQYRGAQGAALLAPGALLLGDCGDAFECGHEHAAGDRCLAFHFAPERIEAIAGGVPGLRRARFGRASLPPLPLLEPLLAACAAERDAAALEELSLLLAGAVLSLAAAAPASSAGPTAQEARRITRALRRIEAHADEAIALADLAAEAAMSPYHFLRVFTRVVGMTPHQFVLRTRLHRAAVRLGRGDDPVATIAFAAGFNDLSTFNRRFRRIMGVSPSAYRNGARRLQPAATE